MALKKSRGKGVRITGYDREHGSARAAQRRGSVDTVESALPKAVQDAGMVIIATPVMASKEVMELIAPHLQDGCVVTDTGSTKGEVLKWADQLLPRHANFVGGHPLAGKEKSGPGAADVDLFQGAHYCIMPAASASKDAVQAVAGMVEMVGAKPFFIDVQEHDCYVAAVSHMPIVLSSALVASTTKSPSWHEMSRLAATGYRDVTRLASGDPEMNRDICATNAQEIGPWIDRLIVELQELRRHLEECNEEALAEHFAFTYMQRERWTTGVPLTPGRGPSTQLPGVGEQFANLMFGKILTDKAKTILREDQEPEEGERRKR